MADHGGYRKPSKPAAASGPGSLSQRTDRGPQPKRQLPDAAYGEQQTFQDAQSGGPMAGSGPAMGGSGASAPAPAPQVPVVPFGAPSTRPDEPVTTGADSGPGPGLASLGLTTEEQRANQADMEQMRVMLPYLEWVANQPGSSQTMKMYVRKIKAQL